MKFCWLAAYLANAFAGYLHMLIIISLGISVVALSEMHGKTAYIVISNLMTNTAFILSVFVYFEHVATIKAKHPETTYFGLQWSPGASKLIIFRGVQSPE